MPDVSTVPLAVVLKSKGLWDQRKPNRYVTDAKALNAEIVCVTGGEPMLYPDLVRK